MPSSSKVPRLAGRPGCSSPFTVQCTASVPIICFLPEGMVLGWPGPSGQGAPPDAAVLGWESPVMMYKRCRLVGSLCMHCTVQSCGSRVAPGLCTVVNQLAELAAVCKDAFTKQVCNVDGGGSSWRVVICAGAWAAEGDSPRRPCPFLERAVSADHRDARAVPSPGVMPCASPALACQPDHRLPVPRGCRCGSTHARQGVCGPSSNKGWGGALLLGWAQASRFFPNPGQKYLQGAPAALQQH